MPPRAPRKTPSVATQAVELAVAVPQVVAHRMARIAISGPTPSARDLKEFQRMVDEKTSAFTEAWQAMAVQSLQAQQTLVATLLHSLWAPASPETPTAGQLAAQIQSATLDVVGKGLAPVHSKAVANARRLARTRLR